MASNGCNKGVFLKATNGFSDVHGPHGANYISRYARVLRYGSERLGSSVTDVNSLSSSTTRKVTILQSATPILDNASSPYPVSQTHEYYMRMALEEARRAFDAGEVPVGAVLVGPDGDVAAAAHNSTETDRDPTSHAEILCIREAAVKRNGWRLLDSTLYVTLEPCPMCAGALLQARVGAVVYGARNFLLGADGSWIHMLRRPDFDLVKGSRSTALVASRQENEGTSPSSFAPGYQLADSPRLPTNPIAGTFPEASRTNIISSNIQDSRGDIAMFAEGSEMVSYPRKAHPFHPNLEVISGVLEDECAALMRSFFSKRRRRSSMEGRLETDSDDSMMKLDA